ncbi:MAG: RNA polymerase sigma factor [Planctomycetota bacterium]
MSDNSRSQEARGSSIDDVLAQRDWAVRLAISLVGDAGTGEEIANEAMLRAWMDRGSRPVRHPRAWLRTFIVRRVASSRRSSATRDQVEGDYALAQGADRGADLDVSERAELHRQLVTEIEALPQPLGDVLLRRYFDGWSARKIADARGESLSAVEHRLVKARRELRQRLERRGDLTHWLGSIAALARPSSPAAATPLSANVPAVVGWVASLAVLCLAAAVTFSVTGGGAEPGQRIERVADAREVESTHVLDGAAGPVPSEEAPDDRGLGRRTAGALSSEALESSRVAEGLFRGRLVERGPGGSLRPLDETVRIWLGGRGELSASASPVDGDATEIMWSRFIGRGDAAAIPSVLQSEPIEVAQGQWTMAVPDTDRFVAPIHATSGNASWRVRGARWISAGDREATIEVERMDPSVLTLEDRSGGAVIETAELFEVILIPQQRSTALQVSGAFGRDFEPEPGAFEARRPRSVRGQAFPSNEQALHPLVTSPGPGIAFRSEPFAREFWVRVPGYELELIEWAPGTHAKTVQLSQVGGLEWELFGSQAGRGVYRASLTHEDGTRLDWKTVLRDGVYRAADIGEGEWTLSLRRKHRIGELEPWTWAARVRGGETSFLRIDLAELETSGHGAVRIEILPERQGASFESKLRLRVAPEDERGRPRVGAKSWRLSAFRPQSGRRVASFEELPAGRYVAALDDGLIVQAFEITEGETANVEFDLSQLAEVEVVAPGMGGDEARTLETQRLSVVTEIGETIEASSKGTWRFVAPPVPVRLSIVEPTGDAPYPAPVEVQLRPGPNRIELR